MHLHYSYHHIDFGRYEHCIIIYWSYFKTPSFLNFFNSSIPVSLQHPTTHQLITKTNHINIINSTLIIFCQHAPKLLKNAILNEGTANFFCLKFWCLRGGELEQIFSNHFSMKMKYKIFDGAESYTLNP